MRIVGRPLRIFSIFTILLALSLTATTTARPEKVTFPSNYKSQVLYTTVDRLDNKQVRDIYASPDAIFTLPEIAKALAPR